MDGTSFGRYQLLERLGGGGFSTVFKAQPPDGGAPVALKLLHPEYNHDPSFVRRFQDEAKNLMALPANPHIVKPIEFGVEDERWFLVMEYIDGWDLSRSLDGGRRLPADQVISIGLQVAEALEVAHHHGLIHRDIKPSNLRLTPSGIVKVLDFGIAKATHGTRLTQTGAFPGTPEYVPPEVWEGEDATARSDIYALGIVMYEALAGKSPFAGKTEAAVMHAHLFNRPAPLTSFRKDLPPGLDSIVLRAMARYPQQRFRSAGEMLAALRSPDRAVPVAEPVADRPARSRPSQPPRPPSGLPPAYLITDRSQYPLRRGATIIGRTRQCHIALDDQYVTQVHAQVEQRGVLFLIRDLGGTNGTYVNGQRVQGEMALQPGDRVQLGRTTLVFARPQAPAQGRAIAAGPEDGLWAAFCHGSVLLTIATTVVPILPALVPLLIWVIARRDSSYVGFHAKQAALFQLLVVFLLTAFGNASGRPLLWLTAIAIGWLAAFRCSLGYSFRYPALAEIAEAWR